MTYAEHLAALVSALQTARPDLSSRSISVHAGLNAGYLSQFSKTGNASASNMAALVASVRKLCPTGSEGDDIRALLAMFDDFERKEDAA